MAYDACNSILIQVDDELTAAEAHGMAAGMLCVNEQANCSFWLAELSLNQDSLMDEDKELLTRLFDETKRLLVSDEFEFELFLPDDDSSLIERVEALRNWCRGYLFGIGLDKKASDWSKDVREILRDISEFTKIDDSSEGEEDENSFTEITEYLRSAVLLLRMELGGSSARLKNVD
jgi:uncharacterized protein